MEKINGKMAISIMAIVSFSFNSEAQFLQNPSAGNWRIDNATYNVAKVSLSTGTSYPYAFFIDGANLSANTGDVFGTDAPSATATAWYMRMGGTVIAKYWNGGSNNELNIGTIQTTMNPHLNFYTANTQRMTILGSTNPGFVGIANTAPAFQLSLGTFGSAPDGGILAVGVKGSGVTLPGSLTGARMIWYPKKAAFRAGVANTTEWDDANIGDHSAAFGVDTKASGDGSLASGQASVASGQNSVAIGGTNIASATCALALGHSSEATAYAASAIGNLAKARDTRSIALGTWVRTTSGTSYESIIIGSGIGGSSCYFDNNIPQSLMVGFNSDVPTLFVGPAPNGTCGSTYYTGNVGIATITPAEKLTVNGNLRLENFSNSFYLNNERFLASAGGSIYQTNIYLGIDAGPATLNASTGVNTICIGSGSGGSLNDEETDNVFVGGGTGAYTQGVAACRNTFLGSVAGFFNTDGYDNTYVGYAAGATPDLDNHDGNVIIGAYAGTTGEGDYNVMIGHYASSNGFFDNSVAIGVNAVIDGSSSVAIGDGSFVNGNSSVALGHYALVQTSDAIALGSTSSTRTLIGYTTAPSDTSTGSRLYVNKITGNRAAFFNGSVATSQGFFGPSDINLKNNIEEMGEVDLIIDQLNPKTFTFNQANYPGLNLPSGMQYGLIAQELEQVLPGLVETEYSPPILDTLENIVFEEVEYKAVNYAGLVPILIQGLKDQKERIDQLELLVVNCCNESSLRLTNPAIKVELSNSII